MQAISKVVDKEIDSVLREIKDFPNEGINFEHLHHYYFIQSLVKILDFSLKT